MAKRTTKQGSTEIEGQNAPEDPRETSEGSRSSLISSIYARRYGSTSAEAGVGVTPPSEPPEGSARRK